MRPGGTPRTDASVHDRAGNVVFDGRLFYQYDGFNRLVQFNDAAGLTAADVTNGRLMTAPRAPTYPSSTLARAPAASAPHSRRVAYNPLRRLIKRTHDAGSTGGEAIMDFFTSWLTHTWAMLLEAAPWLLGGFFVAGVIYVLLPADKVVKHLGRPGLGSVLKAALVGVPLPLCSCSVIPVASSLRQRGASRGATASFLISTPESGADSIGVSYALLGPFMAIVRPLAAFITATTAGLLISARGETDNPSAPPAEASCPHCAAHGSPAAPRLSLAAKLRQAAHHGFVVMFANLAHWLLLGFLLGGLVSAFIPTGFFEQAIGTGIVPMLLMLVAGLPLYVCATSATPLAAALIAKGLSPGAALVFMLVGPATNLTTMLVVARDLGRKSLLLYIGTIAVVAVLLGLAVDALPASWVLAGLTAGHVHHHGSTTAWPFAVLLVALLLNGLRVRLGLRLPRLATAKQHACCSDNSKREHVATHAGCDSCVHD